MVDIYLASRSPRRAALLDQIRVRYQVLEVDVDETWNGKEPPQAFVTRLALEKARAGRRIAPEALPVLGADTEVVLDDRILGKPADRDAALAMLRSLSGRSHLVYSAVALEHRSEDVRLSVTRVEFRAVTPEECLRYVDSGEPFGKSGGYGIQGLGALFVTRLEGSFSGVVGLPLLETGALLEAAGIAPLPAA
ncbi:MAG TPA: Maf family protein [Gammaproteobacteria bacterium]